MNFYVGTNATLFFKQWVLNGSVGSKVFTYFVPSITSVPTSPPPNGLQMLHRVYYMLDAWGRWNSDWIERLKIPRNIDLFFFNFYHSSDCWQLFLPGRNRALNRKVLFFIYSSFVLPILNHFLSYLTKGGHPLFITEKNNLKQAQNKYLLGCRAF